MLNNRGEVGSWVKDDQVYQAFIKNNSEREKPTYSSYQWLRDLSNRVDEDIDVREEFRTLIPVWKKIVAYMAVFRLNKELVDNASKELKIYEGLQLKHCKSFADNCHTILCGLHDLGIREPKDIEMALDALMYIGLEYYPEGMMDSNINPEAMENAKYELLQDIEYCSKQYPFKMKNAFENFVM